jgi:hypothetical protein
MAVDMSRDSGPRVPSHFFARLLRGAYLWAIFPLLKPGLIHYLRLMTLTPPDLMDAIPT